MMQSSSTLPLGNDNSAKPDEYTLNLLVQGFLISERQLLDAVVQLSQRRKPRINLLSVDDAKAADVVIIDAMDAEASRWASMNEAWLQHKPVIWVDAQGEPGPALVHRPVQWSILPTMLARVMEQTSSSGAKQSPLVALNGSQSVLVVDDSLAVRSQLRSWLESHNLKVSDVDNAESAIRAVATTPFACVLLDVLMPGMDGYEACRQIKANAHGGNTPAVIMLTSKSSSFDRIRGKMAGCDAYLTKPVDREHLTAILLQHIGKPAAEDPVPSIRATTMQFA